MFNPTIWHRAWRSLWELRPRHDVPAAARLLAISLVALVLAVGLMTVVAVFGTVSRRDWWWPSLLPNAAISLCIVHGLFGALRLAERRLPAALVERMSELRDLRAGILLGTLALASIVAGMTLGFSIVPLLFGVDLRGMFVSLPAPMMKFAVFLLCVMGVNWAWWGARLRQQRLRQEASEARLRLLQGQIEPHLLFNTLANVQSLMDYDPARAKRMLETFSAYLRTGLAQLRETDSTLAAELEMARNYLALLQIRMEDRLRFRIEAGAAALAAPMPTLLLQPLVENAIHHALEPTLEGGSVVVQAEVRAGRLVVRVIDDGIGLDTPSRRLRPGAGMALANLRARLQTKFGSDASLVLRAGAGGGTEALLDLPWQPAPAPREAACAR